MTARVRPDRPSLAGVVPRWEWRTFGDFVDADQVLAALGVPTPAESDETYILSMYGDASVKIRGGLLDIKVLYRVNGAGLQLWVPTTKVAFPVDDASVATALAALGVPPTTSSTTTPPTTGRSRYGYQEFLGVIEPSGDLRVVEVHKSRHRSVLDDCMVEYTEVTAGGNSISTIAVESPDPELVCRTIAKLGLEPRRNTCVAAGLRTLLGWVPTRFAVLDVGTNSVKFIIGARRDGSGPQIVADTAVVTRLGQGLTETGDLSAAAIERTVDAIANLVDHARREGPVDIAAVGTAGLRQAHNRDTFLQSVLDRCGVTVEVISGPEEARLAYRAAVSSLPATGDRLLVFDSGGGSSQFTFGTRTGIEDQFSVDVGAVRFSELFGLTDTVPRATVDAALAAIAKELDGSIGGTSTNLAAVSHALATYDPDVVHGTIVGLAEVDRQIELYRQLSADQRRQIPGLQPARAEVILAGACIVRTILTLTGQDAVTVSDRGLRHGVVAERFSR